MSAPLITSRLLLRPYCLDDAPALAAQIGVREVAQGLARVPYPYGLADAQAFIAKLAEPDTGWHRGIFLHGDSTTTTEPPLIGGISVENRELGYWLGRDYWGKGYATEAVRATIAADLANCAAPLIAEVMTDNGASARVLEKCGFVRSGQGSGPSLARGGEVSLVFFRRDPVPQEIPA